MGDRILDDNPVDCEFVRSDYAPPTGVGRPVSFVAPPTGSAGAVPAAFDLAVMPVAAQPVPGDGYPPDEPGAWYVFRCEGPGEQNALYRPPVWIPDAAQPGGTGGPSVSDVAEQARNQLRLPSPVVATSPRGDQLVRLPTWLWVDPAAWGEVSATAAAPGVSVTAVARPSRVVWSTGDGGGVVCAGPGTPFPAGGDPEAASPDCGYTYPSPSSDSPGGVFTVTATVSWDVSWAGAGQAGVFPGLTTASVAEVRVVTVPALTTGGG